MEALGGKEAWKNTHYLRFDFAVEREGKTVASRAHTWDKWTGRYRLEGTDREGKTFVGPHEPQHQGGTALKDGKPVEGEELKKQLERAYGAWVNDTYWLLMPYKMKDPGVILAYDGEAKEGDACWTRCG